jgi:transposase InsO family protein
MWGCPSAHHAREAMQNGLIESFNGRFIDEAFNPALSSPPDQECVATIMLRADYNNSRLRY